MSSDRPDIAELLEVAEAVADAARIETLRYFRTHDLGTESKRTDFDPVTVADRDAEAAWRYLTKTQEIPEGRIIVFGRSMGASAAAYLAAKHHPLALIVESSFTSVPDIAREIYPWLPVRWLSRLRHSAKDFVRQGKSPVLVIHSRDDEIVPFHHGEAIFAAARGPRAFLEIRGTHNDAFLRDEHNYITGLRSFLDTLPTHD